MMWMDVDAAVVVPVNLVPLTDDTDFKTRETSVAYNAAGMDLVWNFVTTAGVVTQTAVTPTTGGDYDWTHKGDGMYAIEIPASGGASIDNDAAGYGYFTGFATGVLPWRSPTFGFRAAALNALLVDDAFSATRGLAGTALPAAAADAAGGLVVSDAGGLDIDTKLAATNEVTAARMGALTDLINGGRLDLLIDAIKAVTDNLPDSGALSSLATVTALTTVDSNVDAIKAKTDNLPTDPADQSLIINATDALVALIGSPANADIAADIAEVLSTGSTGPWTTGAGGGSPQVLQTTTIATLASQVSFTLTAGSADDDAYNGAMAVVTDQSTGTQKAVGLVSDYAGSTRTVTLKADPGIFTMATGDAISIIATPKQLPNGLPDGAGGLPVSDAGGLDLDTVATNVAGTNTATTVTIPGLIGTPSVDLAADILDTVGYQLAGAWARDSSNNYRFTAELRGPDGVVTSGLSSLAIVGVYGNNGDTDLTVGSSSATIGTDGRMYGHFTLGTQPTDNIPAVLVLTVDLGGDTFRGHLHGSEVT